VAGVRNSIRSIRIDGVPGAARRVDCARAPAMPRAFSILVALERVLLDLLEPSTPQ